MTKIITAKAATADDIPQVAGHRVKRGHRVVHRNASEHLIGRGQRRSAFLQNAQAAADFLNGDDTNLYAFNPRVVRMWAMRR